jgi:hypothetical protein
MKSDSLSRRLVAATASLVVFSVSLDAATLHVGQDATAEFRTIQDAVRAAVPGDVIVINPGVYRGPGNCDINLAGKAIIIQSTDPLDAQVAGATVVDCASTPSEPHQGFYLADCNGVEISGLTVMNGRAPAGGAVFCKKSKLSLSHCRIVNNAALPAAVEGVSGGPGGGVYGEDSFIRVVGCLVAGNAAGDGAGSKEGPGGSGGDGGGICGVRSETIVEASTIRDNVAGAGGSSGASTAGDGGDGGGIYGYIVTLVNTSVSFNRAGAGGRGGKSGGGGHGGGVRAQIGTVDRCIIEGNRAGAGGTIGLGTKDSGGPGGQGGGFYSDSLEITNSLVVGNRAGKAYAASSDGLFQNGNGGGLYCMAGSVRQCTIAGNAVSRKDVNGKMDVSLSLARGAGIFRAAAVPIENSILYENTPPQETELNCDTIRYCDIPADVCAKGTGTFSAPPLFVQSGRWGNVGDPDLAAEPDDPNASWVSGDYHLRALSPCVDAGDPNYLPEPNETDLDGRPRLAEAAVDLGAYEFQNLSPVYRFWSPVTGKHFYTIDAAEKDWLIETYSDVWTFEGIVYYACVQANEPNLLPVYRFWSSQLGGHFYTIDEAEKDNLIAQYPDVWTFEGPVFFAWPEGRQPVGARPVYRFWSDVLAGHFYTIDEAERDNLLDQYQAVWTYEGIAWYAYETPVGTLPPVNESAQEEPAPEEPVEEPMTPNPVAYDFTSGSDGVSYLVQLQAYLDDQPARLSAAEMAFVPQLARMGMVVDLGSLTATMNDCHVESQPLEFVATISNDAGMEVPFVLQVNAFLDAAVTRGPYDIDSNSLSFPVETASGLPAADDTVSLAGTVTLDGRKLGFSLTAGVTRFDAEGRAQLDTTLLPGRLDAQMPQVFRWSRQGQEDLLFETTVKDRVVRLAVTSVRVETGGLWHGKPTLP